MRRQHTNGEDNEVDTAGDLRGSLPTIRNITGIQGVPLDQDGLSRVEIRFDGGVIVKYVGISQKEDDGSTVACTPPSKITPHCREKPGDLTEQSDGGEVPNVPRPTENENSCVVQRHLVEDVEYGWDVNSTTNCLAYIPLQWVPRATVDCAAEFICFALLCGHLEEMGGMAPDWPFGRI